MADNVDVTQGAGKTVASDDIQVDGTHAQGQVQFVKLVDGTLNGTASVAVDVGAKANALRVAPANDITDATYVGNVKVTSGAITETNSASLAVVGGGTEATALRVTLANNSTGVITVDGTVTADLSAIDNAVLDTIDAALDAINAKLVTGTIIGDVNLGATDNAVLDTIDAALDAINAKLVTGTVIGDVNLGATDNAVLDVIAGDTTSIDGKITACNTGAVVISSGTVTTVSTVTSLSQMSGAAITMDEGVHDAGCQRVTIATDDDGVAHLATIAGDTTSIDGAIYVDDADWTDSTSKHMLIGGIYQSAPQSITDGDTGPLQVTSTGALIVSGGGGGTEYTEDVATANPIVGTATMMERDDVIAGLTPAAGDWASMRCSAEGALWIQDFNSDAALALLGTIDGDTSNITACNTGAVVIASGTVDTVTTVTTCSTVTNLSQMSGTAISIGEGVLDGGCQRVTLATDDDGVAHLATIAGDTTSIDEKITACNTGAVVVSSGTITANLGATDNAVLDQIELNTDPLLVVGSGAEATAIRVTIANDSTGLLSIDDGGGEITVDGTVTANLSATDNAVLDTIDDVLDTINTKLVTGTIIGDVNLGATDNAVLDAIAASLVTIDSDTNDIKTATEIMDDWDATHDSAASADGPQLMGSYDSTKPTAVGDGDAVRILADAYGRLLAGVEPQHFQAVYDSADATAEAEVVHASAASTVIVVQSYVISSDVEGWIKLQDEDSAAKTGKFWLKAGGGVAITLPDKAPIVLGVDKDLEVIAEAAGNVSVTVTGYTIPG